MKSHYQPTKIGKNIANFFVLGLAMEDKDDCKPPVKRSFVAMKDDIIAMKTNFLFYFLFVCHCSFNVQMVLDVHKFQIGPFWTCELSSQFCYFLKFRP